ncbi:MAG: DNA polymerase III subunit delta' [Lutibacter sp.]|uniref:DNA polymerase III subunit n=1 Tax=Lutibacter sp. TaxID=1925666 RepID=UPI0017D89D35|nr:DNA polymerase III subunit delta' [Lutibacter sp.]MBT8317633.1 DNA polymerase III subunit delta' [Lutibacter sp.]NNJ58491.1 DNA polymerase III subunit delta' [Lutibacter sp.]
MNFSEVIGQEYLKSHLMKSTDNGRIPHAQLFVGKEGSGTLPMAIAYAQYILCSTSADKEACALKCAKLAHPDLHFAFPVAKNDVVKSHPVSNLFLTDWRKFIELNPYGNLFEWLQSLGIENKQGQIGVDEAEEIVKALKLKSYEGGYKIMIIWMAEKMNTSAANKLLKLLEEPPKKTVFILVTEDEEQLITTIKSRCQVLHFPILTESDIAKCLVEKEGTDEPIATNIAQQSDGNFNKALHLLHNDTSDEQFEQWFITWIRAAFKAKGNATVIQSLINWSETIAKTGRETQKRFLHYCLQFFRQAILLNYNAGALVFLHPKTPNFKLENFAPFVHSGNILAINKELNDAIYHIERNGNAKIILLDLSIKLTRLLHIKEEL